MLRGLGSRGNGAIRAGSICSSRCKQTNPFSFKRSTFATISDTTDVAIIGSGIGGLSASAFLRKKGFTNISIFEQGSHEKLLLDAETGNGIHLYFDCARMLVQSNVNVGTLLVPINIRLRDHKDSVTCDISLQQLTKIKPELARLRSVAYSIMRPLLIKRLYEATPRESLHFSKKLVKLVSERDYVVVHFADGSSTKAKLVIGADGINSSVASQFLGKRENRFYPYRFLYGCSSASAHDDSTEESIFVGKKSTFGVLPCVLQNGKRGSCWWYLYHYEDAPDNKLSLAFAVSEAKSFHVDALDKVLKATYEQTYSQWTPLDSNRTPPVEKQNYGESGRIVLLGDAIHSVSPTSLYNVGTTIEDSYWLARSLGGPEVFNHPYGIKDALENFSYRRLLDATTFAKTTQLLTDTLVPGNESDRKKRDSNMETGKLQQRFVSEFGDVLVRRLHNLELSNREIAASKLEL